MFAPTFPFASSDSTPHGAPRDHARSPLVPARADEKPRYEIQVGFSSGDERGRVLGWLDDRLRDGRSGRVAGEFPLLFQPASTAKPVLARTADGRLASFCVLWPIRFELAGRGLSAGLVSLVFTDERDRGRGLARAVIARAIEEASRLGLGLCLLWSDLSDFYAAQGFTRAGRENLVAADRDTVLRAREVSASNALRVEPLRADDWPDLLALRAERTCRVPFEPDAAAAFASLPDLEGLVVRDGQRLRAFALRGRGDDFRGVVHEWGGDPEGVLACCAHWLAPGSREDGLLLLSPGERTEVAWRLRRAGARSIPGPLAWFRIASLATFLAELAVHVPASVELFAARPAHADRAGDGRREIAMGHGADAVVLSEQELLALVFSPADEPESAAVRARLASDAFAPLRAAFPLPFFVWGLESI